MSDIKIDFTPIIDAFVDTLRIKHGMSEDEAMLYIKSKKGRDDFEVYCTECIKLQVMDSLDVQ